jgi:hypothetical protein
MLFLAITGALTAAIMVGAGTAVNAQRYKDAVATFQSDIQQQYEDILSVKNSEFDSTTDRCEGSRGQRDCVLMGKLMMISSDASASRGTITQYSVYGVEPSAAPTSTDDFVVMRQYAPAVLSNTRQANTMEWGTYLTYPQKTNGVADSKPGAARSISILVLRSPLSGRTYTFSQNDAIISDDGGTISGNITPVITPANSSTALTLCVATTGWVVGGGSMAIYVGANASSVNAVEIRTNDMMATGGTQC